MNIYRRKHRPVPVSFFAFQDIITALAGCMLIFVLIMATAKSRFSGGVAEADLPERNDYDLLQEKIKLHRSLLAAEESKNDKLRQQINRSTVNEKIAERNRSLESAGKKLEKTFEQRSKMLKDMQQQLADLKKHNQTLAAEKRELAALIKRSIELEQQYNSQRRKFLFADKNRQNIVLHISRSSWQLQTAAGQTPEQLGNSVEALPLLIRKLQGLPEKSTRLIIGVRPSGGGFAEPLKRRLKNSFPGMEIVSEPLEHETAGGVDL